MPRAQILVTLIAALAAACAPPGPTVSRGEGLYMRHCASCHGSDARGGGARAEALSVAVPGLTGLAAAHGGTFPSEAVIATICGYRGKQLGATMPEFGPLFDGPTVGWITPDGDVIETPEALVALTRYLASVQDEI